MNESSPQQLQQAQAKIKALEQQLRQRNFELEVLAELSQQIIYPLSDKELLILLLQQIHKALEIDVCAGLITGPHGTCDFILRPQRPLSSEVQLDIQQRLAESFQLMSGQPVACDLAAEARLWVTAEAELREQAPGQPPSQPFVQIPDQQPLGNHIGSSEAQPMEQLGSVFLVPMIVESSALEPVQSIAGMLLIAKEVKEAFTQAHIHFLYAVANQGAISLKCLRSHLNAEKERLANIMADLPEGVALLDAEGQIVLANAVAQEYLVQLLPPNNGPALKQLGERPLEDWIQLALHPLESMAEDLGPIKSPTVWHEVSALDDPDAVFEVGIQVMVLRGQQSRFLMVIRDIRERKATERFKDELIAVISHELFTPLSLIKAPLELFSLGTFGEVTEPGQQMLEVATEGLERLSQIVQNVVNLAGFESGQLQVVKQDCLAEEILEWAIHASLAEAKLGEITLVQEPCNINLLGDPSYLQQAIHHFILNAIKFSPTGGRIVISAALEQCRDISYVTFKVQDWGTGITAEQRHHIFGRFSQADMSATRSGNGLGLGLAVCQFIAQQHQGKILLESSPGKGSIFMLKLPQTQTQA